MWSTQGTTRTFITKHHTAVQRGLGGPGTGRWYLCHRHTAITLLSLQKPLWLLIPPSAGRGSPAPGVLIAIGPNWPQSGAAEKTMAGVSITPVEALHHQ